MTTARPTPAQRDVLEMLAQGYRMFFPDDDMATVFTPQGGGPVPRRVVHVLLREGWIFSDDTFGLYWRISDMGRQALTPAPEPASAEQHGRDGGE